MKIDEQTVRRWWQIFVNGMTEIRLLDEYNKTKSGYFKKCDNAVAALQNLKEDNSQVYFILNELSDGCYSRKQRECIVYNPKSTSSDNDVTRRTWLLIDLDPKRPTGVSSTDSELQLAHDVAVDVYKGLQRKGFPEPVVCMSGNGWHLLYKVDMPNDKMADNTVSEFLDLIQVRYGTDKIDVDQKVKNPARISKLYGTEARKGLNTPERPWRMSRIVKVPDTIATLPTELLEAYVAQYKVKTEGNNNPNGSFSLQEFFNKHHINVKTVKHLPDGRIVYNLAECPFNNAHKDGDACVILMPSGALKFSCFHNSCSGHDWFEYRKLYEPDYEPNRDFHQPQSQQQQPIQEPPKPKAENEADGKKWLDFADIELIDTSTMPKIKTGFASLDRHIRGFYLSELIVLSGRAGSGKSSWINTLVLNVLEQDFNIAIWSGELPPHIMKLWLYNAAVGNILVSFDKEGGAVPRDEHIKMIDKWMRGRLMLYNNNYGSKWSQVFGDMDAAAKKGAKLFVLDNLMTLDIDIQTFSQNEAQKTVVNTLKEFAVKNMVVVLLVCHPRKVTTFIRNEDISGSSDIVNKADDVLIIHRVGLDFYRRGREYLGNNKIKEFAIENSDGEIVPNLKQQGNVIEISKNRIYGNQDVLVGFHYNPLIRRFHDSDEYLGSYMSPEGKVQTLYKCEPYGWWGGGQVTDYKMKIEELIKRGYKDMNKKDDVQKKPPPNIDRTSPEARELTTDEERSDAMDKIAPQLWDSSNSILNPDDKELPF